jgi:hypothetical protein
VLIVILRSLLWTGKESVGVDRYFKVFFQLYRNRYKEIQTVIWNCLENFSVIDLFLLAT